MAASYIEAPYKGVPNPKFPSIFLAGGITDCWNWQASVYGKIKHLNLNVYNPRRVNAPNNLVKTAEEQIAWEYKYLRECQQVAFWFPEETLCPIVLFELGAALERHQHLIIGCHKFYKRRLDLEIQLKLKNEYASVITDINKFVDVIIDVNS